MHCHLDLYPDPFKVAHQCMERGVYVLSVTTTPKAWSGTSQLTFGNPRIKVALGFHPQLAHERFLELELFDEILPSAECIGEIGLDGGSAYKKHRDVQLRIFRHILHSVQKAGGRIISIHSRGSAAAVLSELAKFTDVGVPIMHWFTGNVTELRSAIKQDCWFSIGPAMLATKRGQEIVAFIPNDRILPETDGPFAIINKMSLNPWDASKVSAALARIWRISEIETNTRLIENFKKLTGIMRCK
jgi:TatD DNase family protein